MGLKTEYIDRNFALDVVRRTSGDYAAAFAEIEHATAADVAPVVRCKNCIYWKDRHIKMNDGTERSYTEEELHQFCGMVPLSIGINVSSYCTRIKLEDTYFWCGPDDFCSKGARMDGGQHD